MTGLPGLNRRAARSFTRPRDILAGAALFLLIVLISGGTILVLSVDARREIDALATASADNMQWTLAQAEVEFLAFENATFEAEQSSDLGPVRRRFDVFYSRMSVMKAARAFKDLQTQSDVLNSFMRIEAFLDRTVPLIDGTDDQLRAALPSIATELQDLRPDIRAISLAGISLFAQRSQMLREGVMGALLDLGVITFLLFVVLLGAVLALILLVRRSRRQNVRLRRTQERLRSVISTSPEGIIILSEDRKIAQFNDAAERLFGYRSAEVAGRPLADIFRSETEGTEVGTGAAELVQAKARHKSGHVFPIEFSTSSAESEGEINHIFFVRDISQRVAAEHQLLEARDRAVAGERAAANLLAVMSHEIRTPLNGILGTLELLSATGLKGRQRQYAEIMGTSGRMLMDHVNNVLDVSRLDSGKMRIARTAFDLRQLLDDVVKSLEPQAAARGNALTLDMADDGLSSVVSDPSRLRQAVVNLVANAIKFTENGEITVEAERAADSDTVEIRVIDTGIGIAEADLERIFDDFVTLDSSYQRAAEGTGLGLSIVRRLARAMGGDLEVESVPGEGSAFSISLPLPVAEDGAGDRLNPRPAFADGPAPASASVLVVEDNEINRLVVREMLEARGCRVVEAVDGRDGVLRASETRFDLILMDISMPKMDGIEAAGLIANGDGPNAGTPIVALTAHALPDDILRFRKAGMSSVLTKPLSGDRLDRLLAPSSDPSPRTAPDTALPGNLSILGEARAKITLRKIRLELAKGLTDLEAMVADADRRADFTDLAHKLAGSAALAGYADLSRVLADLETGGSTESAATLRQTLRAGQRLLRSA